MFLKNSITTSTKTYSAQIDRLKNEMESADAVVIGAGAGMSVSAGMAYDGERFKSTLPIFTANTESPICIQAAFILIIHLKNIGRGGQDMFS